LYYQNWHITLTKSRNKTASATASATAAAASHHELCMMAMATAIKSVKKNKNKNKNQHFLCVPWLPTPQETFFFYWRNFKNLKFENQVILDFCNRQK